MQMKHKPPCVLQAFMEKVLSISRHTSPPSVTVVLFVSHRVPQPATPASQLGFEQAP